MLIPVLSCDLFRKAFQLFLRKTSSKLHCLQAARGGRMDAEYSPVNRVEARGQSQLLCICMERVRWIG